MNSASGDLGPSVTNSLLTKLKKNQHWLLGGICAALFVSVILAWASRPELSEAQANVVQRGLAGDLLADIEVGKRDFTEIAAKGIVPYKLNSPGGAVVDRSISPGRLYIWDSGNNRILGVDLSKCYNQSTPCSADLIIGQPTGTDYGACNRDASMLSYPHRSAASSTTLCGVPDFTHTTLEEKTFAGMYVDSQGNLFVPDTYNNRILEYYSPSTTDAIADQVWGQPDFSSVYCNRQEVIDSQGRPDTSGGLPNPRASSICFRSTYAIGLGVSLDAGGNLWVADGGNNRVLRFPKDSVTGTISKTADLVLGQTSFAAGPATSGSSLSQLHSPKAVAFDQAGKLYVADSQNSRVLVFDPPFTSGMAAIGTFGSGHSGLNGLQADPWDRGIWTYENQGWDAYARWWNLDGTLHQDLPKLGNNGGGSLGFDANKNVIATTYVYGQDAYVLIQQLDGTYIKDKALFSPPLGYNLDSANRLSNAGWVGVAVAGSQLFVSDGRLFFWNNAPNLTNGQAPNGYLGASSATQIPNPAYTQLKADQDKRIWVAKKNEVIIYQAPLATGSAPVAAIRSPIATLDGSVYTFSDISGLAPTSHGEYLWISEAATSRVVRIKNPLTNPVIDIVLGQTSLSGTTCNRGLIVPPSQNPGRPASADADLTMLCKPGALSLDRQANLYVSDHSLETEGNWRLLMYSASLFPVNPTTVLYAPSATKEFPRSTTTNATPHAYFEATFDSQNRMVIGSNPYLGPRFMDYYSKPTSLNPTNPSDPTYAVPNGKFADFYSWPVAVTFDSVDNLYVYDANRGQVRIYKQPFILPPISFVIQAETMTYSNSNIKSYADTAAISGLAIVYNKNATASKTIGLTSSTGSVVLRAKGDQCNGAPKAQLKVDGVIVGFMSVSAVSWTSYSFNKPLAAGSHNFQVLFTNNYHNSKCDRKLHLDQLSAL
jgi:predicted xylan-binding protein with Ca-dependent carbohydrate-binding module/NHL repeat-containing protein